MKRNPQGKAGKRGVAIQPYSNSAHSKRKEKKTEHPRFLLSLKRKKNLCNACLLRRGRETEGARHPLKCCRRCFESEGLVS